MEFEPNLYNRINILESEISYIFNKHVNRKKGFEFKTETDKYKIDLIIQEYRKTVEKCELEFASEFYGKPFLKKINNKIMLGYKDIHIPIRREIIFRKELKHGLNTFYMRISGMSLDKISKYTLVYINTGKNIINLPRVTSPNKYNDKENFFSDNLTTHYQGFCGTLIECLQWMNHVSGRHFLKGNLKKKNDNEMF